MKEVTRLIQQNIENDFYKGKIILILGPRQVGKTTLLTQIIKIKENALLINCDNIDEKISLENRTTTELSALIGLHSVVLIDEAQRVKNIGLTLKMIADLKLPAQVIVTGSSSLDLADEIHEPATGRIFEYRLFPFAAEELKNHFSQRDENRLLEQRLIFGSYPDVVNNPSDSKRLIMNISNNYLYKDILNFKGLKKSDVLQNLVRALALQLGNEVKYNEISRLLGIDKETVENYINILEKCFIVFRLPSLNRNMRSEIKKGKKVYFYDNGIRNAVISNFSPLELRNDVGALWENYVVSERVKRNAYHNSFAQLYFWRTQQQQEIDLIEDEDGILNCFEIKYSPNSKAKMPASFLENYPNSNFAVVHKENYWQFVT